jgi:hypothetical protein
MIITITHQEYKTIHTFKVFDDSTLIPTEIKRICEKMDVKVIFCIGKLKTLLIFKKLLVRLQLVHTLISFLKTLPIDGTLPKNNSFIH